MLNYKKITVTFIFFFAVIFLLPEKVFAQSVWGMDMLDGLNLGTRSIYDIIVGVINVALGFLGVIAVVIILYGGYIWMTSGGNAERIDKAKRTLINGVIGLFIIGAAYGIVQFFFDVSTGNIRGGGSSSSGSDTNFPAIALGAGVLDSHYPARDARNVPRNTLIYVTFTEDMDFTTIVNDGTCDVPVGIRTCQARDGFLNIDEVAGPAVPVDQLFVTYDSANPVSFSINPYGDTATNLGSDTEETQYKVIMSGTLTANDQPAFGGASNNYNWRFTVSTEVDITPPTVTSVIPVDGAIDVPLNSVVQINFSEAVNPITASGIYAPPTDNFNNISLVGAGPVGQLEGIYNLSNQYKTVEFLTTNDCGTNSCGDTIYCLPEGDYLVDGTVTTNIADMAGNTLELPYNWDFNVIDEIDVDPPHVVQMDPISNVALDADISVRFNEALMANSVNGRNIRLERQDPISGLIRPVNYWSELNVDTVIIHHDEFDPNTDYLPTLKSGIKNTTQNCWYPCDCSDPGGSCTCTNDPSYGNPPYCSGANCTGSDI